MNLNKVTKIVAATVLLSAVSSVQAASLSIITSTPEVKVGDLIELQVFMDFSDDATIGGSFDINFNNSLVSYVSNSYITDAALNSDPDFTRDDNPAVTDDSKRVEVESDKLVGAGFGEFGGLLGPALLAPLSFIADEAGIAVFDLGASTSARIGGFFGAATFTEQFPDFGSVSVNIRPSAVPVPAAVWLFGSGLLGLIGVAQRRRTA